MRLLVRPFSWALSANPLPIYQGKNVRGSSREEDDMGSPAPRGNGAHPRGPRSRLDTPSLRWHVHVHPVEGCVPFARSDQSGRRPGPCWLRVLRFRHSTSHVGSELTCPSLQVLPSES